MKFTALTTFFYPLTHKFDYTVVNQPKTVKLRYIDVKKTKSEFYKEKKMSSLRCMKSKFMYSKNTILFTVDLCDSHFYLLVESA